MPGFFSRLLFSVKGGIPATPRYEARRAALEEKYAKYKALEQTPSLLRYRELAVQVATPRSQSGLPKKEWKMMRREFAQLRKSAEVTDFFKLQKTSHNFHAITDWDLKFEDSFKGQSLDAKKWLSHYYVVGKGLDMDYSPANEGHVYTNGANVSVANQSLKIATKREHATGLGFSDVLGFVPMEREFTSGIVNTGESFQVKYGKVEAKIRFTAPFRGIYHAMWLGAGKKLPHVNIVRIGEKVEFSAFSEESAINLRQHVSLWSRRTLRQNTHYIVALEWSEQGLVWKVNGVTMFSSPNVADEPMYVAFSSGVMGAPAISAQATFEVDWVKVYQRHEPAAAV
jgi:hypothetical protein